MKKIMPVIIAGLIVRLLLIPVTAHPDLRGLLFSGYLISREKEVFTFYDYLSRLPRHDPRARLMGDDLFIYPPAAYFPIAAFMGLLSPFYPWHILENYFAGTGGLNTEILYLFKAPYILIDLMLLTLVLRLVDPARHRTAAVIWLFNPVNLYVTYVIGQFDLYLAALGILAVVLAVRGRSGLASVVLGIAAGFKPFPLFFLPLLPGNKFKNVTAGILTYSVILLPYLSSSGFRQYALFASQTEKLTFARIFVSGSQYLSWFFILYGLLLWWNYSHPRHLPLWGWLGAVGLIFFSVSHWHPQWFMWIAPFLVISAVIRPDTRITILALTGLFFLLVLTFDPSLNFAIFHSGFSLIGFLDRLHLADTVISLWRSLFTATSLWLIFTWSRRSPATHAQ